MQIKIERLDGVLWIKQTPPYILNYLQYYKKTLVTKNFRRAPKFEKILVHTPHPDGGVVTLPGYFKQVIRLIEHNNDVAVIDDRRTPMPDPDWVAVKKIGLRNYQIGDVIDFLQGVKEDYGIVNATGGYGKTVMQIVTYAAWKNYFNTILVVPLKEVFNQTYEKFKKYFPDTDIGRVGDGYNEISEKITITTLRSLPRCAIEKCQLLLADEIQQYTGDFSIDTLTKMTPVRVVGYTATDKNLFNNADKLLTGLFGERLVHVSYDRAVECGAVVPGYVYMLKTPQISMNQNTVEGKIKIGIQTNELRNKLIGKVCSAVPNNWQTLVFVDHIINHLIPLYKHMPEGTRYLHRNAYKNEVGAFALVPNQQKQIIEEYKANKIQHMIATDAFRAGVDIPNVRVVVQAAGGSSEVEVLQEAFRGSRILSAEQQNLLNVDKKTHFILIDFQDNHDSTLQAMAEKRQKIYEKQGWVVKRISSLSEIDWNPVETATSI